MRMPNPIRILLSVMLLVGLSWICYDRLDELRYFFSGQSLVRLGDVLQIPDEKLQNNQFVEVTGVLGNRAALVSGIRTGSFRIGKFQIRHLLGSPVFVEFDQEKYASKFEAYTRITVQGRIVDFGPGSELSQVREFFKRRLKIDLPNNAKLLIVDEKPGEQWRYPILFLIALLLTVSSFWFTFRRP